MTFISNTAQVKQHNTTLVMQAMRSLQSGTKNDVARVSGLSVATCNTILNELCASGKVLESASDGPRVGRPAKLYSYNAGYASILCLCIEQHQDMTVLRYSISDLNGNLSDEACSQYAVGQFSVEDIYSCISEMMKAHDTVRTIAIGVPGVYYQNRITLSGHTFLDGIDLVALLSEKFHCRVLLENDMNATAFGFYYYRKDIVAEDADITLIEMAHYDIIGAGTIVNGHILRGNTGMAGEIKYLNLSDVPVSLPQKRSREEIVRIASDLIIAYSVIINPAIIIFIGDEMNPDLLKQAEETAFHSLPDSIRPRLVYKSDYNEYFLRGLSAIALNAYENLFDP